MMIMGEPQRRQMTVDGTAVVSVSSAPQPIMVGTTCSSSRMHARFSRRHGLASRRNGEYLVSLELHYFVKTRIYGVQSGSVNQRLRSWTKVTRRMTSERSRYSGLLTTDMHASNSPRRPTC